jgi:ABC-type transporter Mla maintaining outer membrane lipid asymmetry ATPase subunit MlaF
MVAELIAELRDHGVCESAIVVTHDLELTRAVATRAAVLIRERFAAVGTLPEVLNSTDEAVAAFLSGEARAVTQ